MFASRKTKVAGRKGWRDAKPDDQTLVKMLYEYCVKTWQVPPAHGKVLDAYIMKLPMFQLFSGETKPSSCMTFRGTDYTTELEILGSSLIAGIIGESHWFMVEGKPSYEAFMKGESWTFPVGHKVTKVHPQHFFIDMLIQSTWDAARQDAFASDLNFDNWQEHIHNCFFNKKTGKFEWTFRDFAGNDLPMRMFIALVKWMSKPEDWPHLRNAITDVYPGRNPSDILDIADYKEGVLLPIDYETVLDDLQGYTANFANKGATTFGSRIGSLCNDPTRIKHAWHPYGPDPDGSCLEHGKDVMDWLHAYADTTLQKCKVNWLPYINVGPEIAGLAVNRGLVGSNGMGSCFVPGTKIACLVGDALVEKPVEAIGHRDIVVAEHGALGCVSSERVLWPSTKQDLIGFEFEDGSRTEPFAAESQPFWTHNAAWCSVDPETAQSGNGFLDVGQLVPGQMVYCVQASSLNGETKKVEVTYAAKRIAKILRETRETPLIGLHFNSGPRSFHAGGFLVALNYPELTVSRIQHGIKELEGEAASMTCTALTEGGVLTSLSFGGLAAFAPMIGLVCLVGGILFMAVSEMFKHMELTPIQNWVRDHGVPMLDKVALPSQEWLSRHPEKYDDGLACSDGHVRIRDTAITSLNDHQGIVDLYGVKEEEPAADTCKVMCSLWPFRF